MGRQRTCLEKGEYVQEKRNDTELSSRDVTGERLYKWKKKI